MLSANVLPQLQSGGTGFAAMLARLPKGAPVVIQDEPKRAVEAKARGLDVLYRATNDNDARYWRRNDDGTHVMSPSEFVTGHQWAADLGYVVMVLCEPIAHSIADARELASWCYQVMTLRKENYRLALPNFGVGHPEKVIIDSGVFDNVLRAMRPDDIWAVHEYALLGNVAVGDHIARYRHTWARCDKVGIPRPRIVVTETGYDILGGHGDGWRNHIGAREYANLLRTIDAEYARDGVVGCVFGFGNGYSWETFNIEGADEVLDVIGHASPVEPPISTFRPGDILSLRPAVNGTNIRRAPHIDADVAGRVVGTAAIKVKLKTIVSRNHGDPVGTMWYEIGGANDLAGFVRSDAAVFTFAGTGNLPKPDPEPAPAPPVPDDMSASDWRLVELVALSIERAGLELATAGQALKELARRKGDRAESKKSAPADFSEDAAA